MREIEQFEASWRQVGAPLVGQMLGVRRKGHPVTMQLRLRELMIGCFLRGSDGFLLTEAVILTPHLFNLRLFEQPFVQIVGLDDHRIQSLKNLPLRLLLVPVILRKNRKQCRVALLLILKRNLLQFPIEHILLEEELPLNRTLLRLHLYGLNADRTVFLVEVEFEQFGDGGKQIIDLFEEVLDVEMQGLDDRGLISLNL